MSGMVARPIRSTGLRCRRIARWRLRQGAYDILSARHIHLRNGRSRPSVLRSTRTARRNSPEEIATDEEALRRDIATFRSQYRDQVERETMSGRGQGWRQKLSLGNLEARPVGSDRNDVKGISAWSSSAWVRGPAIRRRSTAPVMQDRLGAFFGRGTGFRTRYSHRLWPALGRAASVLWNKALEIRIGSRRRVGMAPPGGSTHQSERRSTCGLGTEPLVLEEKDGGRQVGA